MRNIMQRVSFLVIFICSLIALGEANIVDFDNHWQQRQQKAKENAAKAYNPEPHVVTNHFNHHVNKEDPQTSNTTTSRRTLLGHESKFDGSCTATNAIDKCWRCDKNWSKNRKKLADCAIGFGHKTTGGRNGKIYVVTDPSDNDMVNPKNGTLRHAVIQTEPLWIIFKHGMTIKLNQELIVASDKTIDGRGGHIHIQEGAGIMLQYVENVIIHGLHIHDIKRGNGGMIRDSVDHYGLRGQSDGDGISIFGATNVWIDHISMSNCADGLIDAIEGSTAITISNCHFTDHNDVMLFGASDSQSHDKLMQITLAFNHFGKRLIQRMPRCRYGYFHVVNNDYTHWEMYAIGGSKNPTIISQGNRFVAPPNIHAKEITKREYSPESVWKNWLWSSSEDVLVNGAIFITSGGQQKDGSHNKEDIIKAKPGTEVYKLTQYSGALKCQEGKPC